MRKEKHQMENGKWRNEKTKMKNKTKTNENRRN